MERNKNYFLLFLYFQIKLCVGIENYTTILWYSFIGLKYGNIIFNHATHNTQRQYLC